MDGERLVVLGVGIHKFGRFPEKSTGELAAVAGMMAIKDAGMSPKDIQMGFCAHLYQAPMTGTQVFNTLGVVGVPVTVVETGCASGSRAVMLAAHAVRAGECDTCMVVGVEKMGKGLIPLLGMDGPSMSHEARIGAYTAPTMYAQRIMWHMHEYGTKKEHFGKAAEIAHRNGALNPNAQFQKAMTLEEIMNSRMISYPITLYESSSTTDGATAAIICTEKKARQFTNSPIYLAGWAGGSPVSIKGDWVREIEDSYTKPIAKRAYEKAGIGPEDIEIAQVHDAFSPAVIFELEELGIIKEGDGGPFVWEGNTEITGKMPTNTDGGLISRGHPIGATGCAMVYEIVKQFRGEAGPRQVKVPPKTAVIQNSGGGGGTVLILKK